jgi:septal ring factor EnvC (AmiA/AmiB activator)
MVRAGSLVRIFACGAFVFALGLGGCTKKPSQEELTKLEEARAAAESAEKKLAELRAERSSLEDQLRAKEGELQKHEEERDDLKQKMGKE